MEYNDILRILREKNIRITPQRELIIKFLNEKNAHLTAQEIYEMLRRKHRNISFTTVYNTLELLKKLDMIRTVYDTRGNVRYELNYYGHLNLICNKCEKIIDFRGKIIDDLVKELEKELGVKIINYSFDIKIECNNCKELEKISMIG